MPASDTWPCRDAMEPLVMNSASSCDSMVSTNSGFSDDSMEYLSAEERACLMFLEETIESLEAEDDSGVSNDEPDVLSCSPATTVDHLRPGGQTKVEGQNYDLNKVLGKDHKPNGFPTPLVLTNGNKSGESARLPSNPTTTEPYANKSDELADLPPPFIPKPPVKADSSNDSKNKGCPPKTQLDPMLNQMSKTQLDPRLDQKSISVPSDMLMELIPPPSDFMDEPEPAPSVPAQTSKQSQLQPQTQAPAQFQAKPQMQPQTQAPAQFQAKPQMQPQTQAPAQVQVKPQMQPQKQVPTEAEAKLQTQTLAQAPTQDLTKPQTQAPEQDLAKPQTQAPEQDQGKTQTQIPSQDLAKPQTQDQAKPQMQNLFQPQPQLPHQLQAQPTESITIAPPLGFGGQVEDDHPQNTVTPPSRGPLSPTQLDVLRKKASQKKAPEKAPVVSMVRSSGQKVSNQASLTSSFSEGHPLTAVGHSEPKSPPAVAPKPKKLSPKIVLKSHKDSVPGHSLVSSAERMLNPQKVHIEALKKLGLLKADETDSAPSLSSSPPHKIPPPPAFNTTTAPPSGDATHEMKPAEVEAQGKINLILPAQSNPENGGRESPVIRKSFEIKLASLERPKVDFKSVTADHSSLLMNQEKNQEKTNVELSPGQLRRSRSRPASAGSRNEMGIDQLPSNSGKEHDVRRSLGSSPIPPLVQPSTDSQVSPRSHGMISVLFTPHSKNREERKQALMRLGLI